MWTADLAPRMVSTLQSATERIKAVVELSYEALYHEAPAVEEAAEVAKPRRRTRMWSREGSPLSLSVPKVDQRSLSPVQRIYLSR